MEPIFHIYIDRLFVDMLFNKLIAKEGSTLFDAINNEGYVSCFKFLSSLVSMNVTTNINKEDLVDPGKHYKKILNVNSSVLLEVSDLSECLPLFSDKSEINGFHLFLVGTKCFSRNKSLDDCLVLNFDDLKVRWMKIMNLSLRPFPIDKPFLNKWKLLDPLQQPLNSIIIVDPYLKSYVKTLDSNLGLLLEKLLDNYNRVNRLDIAFFFDVDLVNKKSGPSYITCNAFSVWVESFLAKMNVSNYNLAIIDSKNSLYDEEKAEHNRFVITNYWKIKPGRSFDFLDADGVVDGSYDDISISFTFDPKLSATLRNDILRLNNRFYFNKANANVIVGNHFNRLLGKKIKLSEGRLPDI